jgi:hypothetical protein
MDGQMPFSMTKGTRKMNDPREELGPYWPQTALPFGMTPQPTGSLPGLGGGVLPVNQALLSMWDSSKIPIPPAQAAWFPPAAPSANQPAPVAEPLDSAAPAPTSMPPIPSGGILGDFGQERRGILGNLGQGPDDELRTDPWAIRLPFRVPTAPIPIDSLARPIPLRAPIPPFSGRVFFAASPTAVGRSIVVQFVPDNARFLDGTAGANLGHGAGSISRSNARDFPGAARPIRLGRIRQGCRRLFPNGRSRRGARGLRRRRKTS